MNEKDLLEIAVKGLAFLSGERIPQLLRAGQALTLASLRKLSFDVRLENWSDSECQLSSAILLEPKAHTLDPFAFPFSFGSGTT